MTDTPTKRPANRPRVDAPWTTMTVRLRQSDLDALRKKVGPDQAPAAVARSLIEGYLRPA